MFSDRIVYICFVMELMNFCLSLAHDGQEEGGWAAQNAVWLYWFCLLIRVQGNFSHFCEMLSGHVIRLSSVVSFAKLKYLLTFKTLQLLAKTPFMKVLQRRAD